MDMKIITFCIFACSAIAVSPAYWNNVKPTNLSMDPLSSAPLKSTGKIIGGTEVTPNSIPYQVALIIEDIRFCGGSLISRDWILTAAHCTNGASYVRVILGAHNIRRSEEHQVTLTTSTIINHPAYSRPTVTNDIALIKLPYSIPLSIGIQPVQLASDASGTFAGSIARLSGWGKTSDSAPAVESNLRAVGVVVISNSLCMQTYGPLITGSKMCTYGGGIIGGCSGDSGGPLTINGVQIGIASFVSTLGCQSGTPTAYTRVSFFRRWIKAQTGI